jgi:carboxypeptidase C (cathepsin A)
MTRKYIGMGLAALLMSTSSLHAQAPAKAPETTAPAMVPLSFETDHTGTFGGTTLRYKAIVAKTFITDAGGNRIASVVSTSYVRTDVPKGSVRPVLFVFNGGPGSSSVWLHMGLVGPKRVAFGDDIKPETTPPFKITDNTESPLDVADIVLFDPPGTGYSEIVAGKETQAYGVEQDAKITADFIQGWVLANGRANAPKFLMGESYGTVRAARLSKLLAGGPYETGSMTGLTLNGVIMLGQAMDMTGGNPGDDRAYLTGLPTLAATAWYHGAVDKKAVTLTKQIADARAFAAGDYLRVLYLGDKASEAEKEAVAQKLAGLTGLSADYIRRHDLRVSLSEFGTEVLASKGLQVGMYDGRYTLPLRASGGDPVADDPAMGQYVPGFLAALSEYMKKDLGVKIDAPYRAIEFRSINSRWDYGSGPGVRPAKNFATDLAVAMRRNPSLKLMIGAGTYDLVTTMGSADYTVSHAGINPAQVTYKLYESGHMPYMGAESRKAVAADIRTFITSASQ